MTKLRTFSEQEAGRAFSTVARIRLRDRSILPADLAVFAWIAAEAARKNVNPVDTTVSGMQLGFTERVNGVEDEIVPVGLSFNTIKAALGRLEDKGLLEITRTPSTRGETLSVEIK